MKAIHNTTDLGNKVDKVGNYKLKYNFESNSQLTNIRQKITIGWEL